MTQTHKGWRITARDCDILRYLAANRFATVDHILRKFWPGKSGRNHYRRINILRKMGLIEPIIGDHGTRLAYRLSRKAVIVLGEQGTKTSGKCVRGSYRTTFDHDKSLITLRDIFESSPLVSNFQREHVVRKLLAKKYGRQEKRDDRYKVPDALFALQTTKRSFIVALELELAGKSRAVYLRLIKLLCISNDLDVVFFVAKNVTLLNELRSCLEDVRNNDRLVCAWRIQHGFYFCLLEEILAKGLDATFKGEDITFTLNGLAKDYQTATTKCDEKPQPQVTN